MENKIIINNKLKKVLFENGINYSDFNSYLNSNLTNAFKIETKKDTTVIKVIDLFVIHLYRNFILQTNSVNNFLYKLELLYRFRFFVHTHHAQLLLEDLNEIIFRDFIEEINNKNNIKHNHSSINKYNIILKNLCTFAAENNLSKEDFSNKLYLPSVSTLPLYFDQAKIQKIFQETKKHKESLLWKTIFIILLGTGIRINELIALKIKDFSVNDQLISILSKGNKKRLVPIFPAVNEAVLEYLISGGTDLTLAQEGYLFSCPHGYERNKPISYGTIQRNFKEISKAINLDSHFTIHSFRETFIVNCLKSNMQLEHLSQILGYSSISPMLIYTKNQEL